jgi:hypothetical protein
VAATTIKQTHNNNKNPNIPEAACHATMILFLKF